MKASSATAVFQFTLTCSHGPIFICFVSVTTFSVALEALICGLLFSKKLRLFLTLMGAASINSALLTIW